MSANEVRAPVITRSDAVWRGAHRFEAGVGDRVHAIDADSLAAPGPVETLLNAIATCSGTDVLDILAKRRTPVSAMTVEVAAGRRAEHPRRVEQLVIEFRIDGEGITADHAERAIALSFEKYCTVAASLAPDIQVETRLVLNGTEHPARPRSIWRPASASG